MTFCVCSWRWRSWLLHTSIRAFHQHANNKISQIIYRIDYYILWIYCTFDAIQTITGIGRFVCTLLSRNIPKAVKLNPSTSAVTQNGECYETYANIQMETDEIIMRLNAFAIPISYIYYYTRRVYFIFFTMFHLICSKWKTKTHMQWKPSYDFIHYRPIEKRQYTYSNIPIYCVLDRKPRQKKSISFWKTHE